MMKKKEKNLESETRTPKEWIDEDKRCHICDLPLHMYEWGDWGYCPKCTMIWNMFMRDNDYCAIGG